MRKRVTDDVLMGKLSPKTQTGISAQVRQFAGFLGRSLDTATVEDLRRYQWDLLDHGISRITLTSEPCRPSSNQERSASA